MKAVFLKVGLFLFLVLFFTKTTFDPDLGWHLAIGNYFWQTGHFLRADIFSWTIPGYVWGNSYFVYEILLSWLFGRIGFFGLVLVFSALIALGFTILVKKLDTNRFGLIILAAAASKWSLGVRPHVFSFLFFSVFLLFLERKLWTKRYGAIVFFGLFCAWANLHRGFAVGLAVFLLVILADWLGGGRRLNRRAVASFLGALLATFLTPFNFLVWSSGIINDFSTYENLLYIEEWQSTVIFSPVNLFFAATGVIFAYTIFRKSLKLDPLWGVLGSFLFAFAFISINFVIFWSAFFVFFESRYFEFDLKRIGRFYKYAGLYIRAAISVFVVLVVVGLGLSLGNLTSLDKVVEDGGYPAGAVDFMRANGLGRNMFNEYAWGGYLDLFYPNEPVFIDGRMAGWKTADGRSILGDFVKIKGGVCDPLKFYKVEVVLMKADFKSGCFAGFTKVYEDKVSKILVEGKN